MLPLRAVLSLFLITMFLFLIPSAAFCLEAPEYKIKATYLYNFAKFTEWPNRKKGAPLFLCILGKDPFQGDLEILVRDKSVDGSPLRIRHLSAGDETKTCHVLFISGTENKELTELLRSLKTEKVLSVGDAANFIELGGLIQFFVSENKVRFEVNLPAVEQAGLKIDARVLKLGKIRR